MSDLEPVTREEKLLDGQELEPITRKEKFIKRIYDKTQEVPEPVTREEYFLKKAGEGGGGDVTIEQLNVSENGTYSEEGKAYSPVVVNVPSAVLGSLNVTENGTYTPPSGVDGYNSVNVDVPLPQNALLLKDIPSTPTAIANFTDGAEMVIPSLTVGVDAWQEGSGDPSPSNVRPIHGWDSVNISNNGINQWDEEWEVGGLNPLNGETTSENDRIRSKNFRPCKPNMTMFYYIPSGKGNLQIVYYDINKNYLGYYNFTTEHTFTTPNGCYFFKFNTGGSYGSIYNNDISINYPSTDTDYHAYNGQTYEINLGDTRYGGTLDVVSGVLTVDRVYVDMGDITWSYDGNGIFFVNNLSGLKLNGDAISSAYATTKSYITVMSTDGTLWVSDARNQLVVHNNAYTSASDFKTAMSGVQLIYELATPLTIQLTPTVIKSLEGENNVFADSGDILSGEYLGGVS